MALRDLPRVKLLVWAVAITVLGALGFSYRTQFYERRRSSRHETTGDLEVIHSAVKLSGKTVGQQSRVGPGDEVTTESAGRARLRLVEGAIAFLDSASTIRLYPGRLELARGKLFVDSPEGAALSISAGGATLDVVGSKVAVELSPKNDSLTVYCSQGELTISVHGQQKRVQSGETMRSSNGQVVVEPEKAFEDFTMGLAVPWQTDSLSRSSLPELVSHQENGEPDAPLYISRQSVDVILDGELSVTRTKSVFHNGQDRGVAPEIRMALPENAQLTKVSYDIGSGLLKGEAQLTRCLSSSASSSEPHALKWAGAGFVTGRLPTISPGMSLELNLEYSAWQSLQSGQFSYRYPFAKGNRAPLIGELQIRVDAEATNGEVLEVNRGTLAEGRTFRYRAAEYRPKDDWVIGYVPALIEPKKARAYVQNAPDGGDPYVMVRLETPAKTESAIRVALVVDSSQSVLDGGLDLARNMVDAIVRSLSTKDSAIVISANETQEVIGSTSVEPVTDAYRKKVAVAMANLRAGGASDLGRALEYAADRLDGAQDATQFNNVIVYLGDGKPSLGTLSVDAIWGRLRRRSSGSPQMSAVAVGGNADLWSMARLVASSGAIYSVTDVSEAARVAGKIVSALEQPKYGDFRLELGTDVDRTYPREGQTVLAGTTTSAFGRLRGPMPSHVTISYLDAGQRKTEKFALKSLSLPNGADVPRRWAEERLRDLASNTQQVEPLRLLATERQLLSPFSAWTFPTSGAEQTQVACPQAKDTVELSPRNDMPYARHIIAPLPLGAGVLEPPTAFDSGQSMEQAVSLHATELVAQAKPKYVACRDARQSLGRALPRSLSYRFSITPKGVAEQIQVLAIANEPSDLPMQRCIERTIQSLRFLGALTTIAVDGSLSLPPPPRNRKSTCSSAASLPLELRRLVWSKRKGSPSERYAGALSSCELPTWTCRRTLLELLLGESQSVSSRLSFALALDDLGHRDASEYVRKRTLDQISTISELAEARSLLRTREPRVDLLVASQLKKCHSDAERLAVVENALTLAPHSPLALRLALLLVENLGDTSRLLRLAEVIRRDPLADAGLLALSASAIGRMGHTKESRRSFSELFERSPSDPWVLAFAGQALHYSGWFDNAIAAFESLDERIPGDSTSLLRLSFAHSAAGRIDIATRLLDRATQTGGRDDDDRLFALTSTLKARVLLDAIENCRLEPTCEKLKRRLQETQLPAASAIVLVQLKSTEEDGVSVLSFRENEKAPTTPPLAAPGLGLFGFYLDSDASDVQLVLSRRLLCGLGRELPAEISIIRPGTTTAEPTRTTLRRSIAANTNELTVKLGKELFQ